MMILIIILIIIIIVIIVTIPSPPAPPRRRGDEGRRRCAPQQQRGERAQGDPGETGRSSLTSCKRIVARLWRHPQNLSFSKTTNEQNNSPPMNLSKTIVLF